MGGSHYPHSSRIKAVKCFYTANSQVGEAMRLLRLEVGQAFLPPTDDACRHFIHYWVTMFERRGDVTDARPPGQHSVITDETAEACVEALLAGYQENNKQRYYRSFRDALARNEFLRGVMKAADIQPTAFWHRLKRQHPGLTRRTLRWVFRLGDATKAARMAYCQYLLSLPTPLRRQILSRVVWLDSKKLYVVPTAFKVYAPEGANLVIEDDRLPRSGWDVKKINYYSAVNAVLGPVYIKICTGTTKFSEWGVPHGYKPYMVGALPAAAACTPASN